MKRRRIANFKTQNRVFSSDFQPPKKKAEKNACFHCVSFDFVRSLVRSLEHEKRREEEETSGNKKYVRMINFPEKFKDLKKSFSWHFRAR